MKRIKQCSLWVLVTLTLCVSILIFTPLGIRLVLSLQPYHITTEHIHGSLAGKLTLEDVTFTHDGLNITCQSLKLQWHPWQLRQRQWQIDPIELDHVTIHTTAHLPKWLPNANGHKPLTWTFQQITGHLHHSQDNTQWALQLIHSPQWQITAHYTPTTDRNHRWSLQLQHNHRKWQLDGSCQKTQCHGISQNQGKTVLSVAFDWAHRQWQLRAHHLPLSQFDPTLPQWLDVSLNSDAGQQHQLTINTALTHLSLSTQSRQQPILWQVRCQDWSEWNPQWQGSLQGQGMINWTMQHSINALHGENLVFGQLHIARIRLDSRINTTKHSNSQLSITGLRTALLSPISLHISAQGTPSNHSLIADFNSEQLHSLLKLNGQLREQRWQGTVNQFEVRSAQQTLKLRQPSHWVFQRGQLTTDGSSWQDQHKKTILSLTCDHQHPAQWTLTAQGLALHPWLSLFNQHINGTGALDVHARWKQQQLQLKSVGHHITLHHLATNIQIPETQLTLHYTQQTHFLQANANALWTNGSQAQFQWLSDSNKKSGKLTLHLTELETLGINNKNLAASGKLEGQWAFTDTQHQPQGHGTLTLNHGTLTYQPLHLQWQDINATATLAGTQLALTLQANNEGKPLIAHAQLNALQPLSGSISLESPRLILANDSNTRLVANTQLNATLSQRNIHIGGQLQLLDSHYTLLPPKIAVIHLPHPDIIIDDGDNSLDTPWQVTGTIDVSLADHVRFTGYNIVAIIGGKGQIILKPHQPILINGRLFVKEGLYSAFGATLPLTPQSYLQYSNTPLDDPVLNITASKNIHQRSALSTQTVSIDQLTVGIQAAGPLDDLKLTLFSSPNTLSENDILSYLLLSGQQNTHHLQSPQNEKSINPVNAIRKGLTLDELSLETINQTDPLGQTLEKQNQISLGKQLTPNMYLRYSHSLRPNPLAPGNNLQLRYTMKDSWVLQMDSSSFGSGADILFSYEH